MRELREVNALGARHGLIRPHDREREHVELLLHLRIGDAAHDVGERSRLRELGFDDRLEAGFTRARP